MKTYKNYPQKKHTLQPEFLVIPTGPKPAQILYSVLLKWVTAVLTYNDFDYNSTDNDL